MDYRVFAKRSREKQLSKHARTAAYLTITQRNNSHPGFPCHVKETKQGFPKVGTGFGIKPLLKQRNLSRHTLAKPGMSA
jgi:hypothetical protein